MSEKRFLFEVSWEVCNKVGGIFTVIQTKIEEAVKNFGENYILIGPMLSQNAPFVEEVTPFLAPIKKRLDEKGIPNRVGYWDIEQKPSVILVGYTNRYNIDGILYNLWTHFGVDSLASNYEYIEPILFSTAASEVIREMTENVLDKDTNVIAQFHEWLCGAGVLMIEHDLSRISTVFTTHATVLGRALAGARQDIYNLPSNFDANAEARRLGVFAKHSLETAAAKRSDCFTTVSNITADEAYIMLNEYPDKVAPNGLDVTKIQHSEHTEDRPKTRAKLLDIARRVVGKDLPSETLLWMTSGRYEFHNKGYDVFLNALSMLEENLKEDSPPIVAFFLVAAHKYSRENSLLDNDYSHDPRQQDALELATHAFHDVYHDEIIQVAKALNFKDPNRKIHIVYCNAYLDGKDGVFDMPYEQVLAACDLSVFPSFYEPWGYTPLESIAHSVPTISSDLAGFGSWVNSLKEDYHNAVYVLNYRNRSQVEVENELCERFKCVIKQDADMREKIRQKAKLIARLADWKQFYNEYLDAYDQAIEFNEVYYARFEETGIKDENVTKFHEAEAFKPRFRSFQRECELPDALSGLRELAYNFWWAWHNESRLLFKDIDPTLWEKVGHNPVAFLNTVSHAVLMEKAQDENYMRNYQSVIEKFEQYRDEAPKADCYDPALINKQHPIAYFCMEYAIDKSLPIYSGGLGVLAGDYVKEMSDLNIPFIAVGLFYRHGYFHQSINFQGEQVEGYDAHDPNRLALRQLNNEAGKPLLVSVEVLNRNIHACVWEVKVGRITLYLLDTNVPENDKEDRKITDALYAGSRETRFLQEIVLGICGVRLIREHLKLAPSLYHLNEGHSAFLLLERTKQLYNQGYSLREAYEIVKATSVFTTHTPVAAGNEAFSQGLVRKYFEKAVEQFGLSIDMLLNVARGFDEQADVFSMTALALRYTSGANGVSKLHGLVARKLWHRIWPGFLQMEVPLGGITNGVHMGTWLGTAIKNLYETYLGYGWMEKQDSPALWKKIDTIPDRSLWEAHQIQKNKFVDELKDRILTEYTNRDESNRLIKDTLKCLDSNTLMICFSRRFAAYKRPDLILKSRDRLARILNNPERPVVLLFAGKAHPADGIGKDLIKNIVEASRDEIFKGRIIFIENYGMLLAKRLTQGVDVWLNNPVRYKEASGTSGMKAGLNGVLNFSIKDGWWDEVCAPEIGFKIKSFEHLGDTIKRNEMEAMFLLDTLEYSVVPTYYEDKLAGFNPAWVKKMKESIKVISCQYNTRRMVKDYFKDLYNINAVYAKKMLSDDAKGLKNLVSWTENLESRFSTVKIKTILVHGIEDGKLTANGLLKVRMLLFSGKLKANELKVELVLIKNSSDHLVSKPSIIPLELSDKRESGILSYMLEHHIEDTGFYSYGIRVYPYNPLMLHPQTVGLVYWG